MLVLCREGFPRNWPSVGQTVEMEEANRFLAKSFFEDFNRRFMVAPAEKRKSFVPLFDARLDDILCLKYPRVVGNDNCVR